MEIMQNVLLLTMGILILELFLFINILFFMIVKGEVINSGKAIKSKSSPPTTSLPAVEEYSFSDEALIVSPKAVQRQRDFERRIEGIQKELGIDSTGSGVKAEIGMEGIYNIPHEDVNLYAKEDDGPELSK